MEDVQPGRARFDADLQAWILSSHGDVTAALREPRLVAVDGPDPAAHLGTRDAMARSLSADRAVKVRTLAPRRHPSQLPLRRAASS